MAAHIRHHPNDAVGGNDTHIALNAVNLTFINDDVVVGLVGAVVDDLSRGVFKQGVALADIVSASRGVVHDRKPLPEQGILFGQLLVGAVETKIVAHLTAPLVDFAHDIVGGVHHTVTMKALAVGEQQNGNHLEQDEQDDEVMLDNKTPQVVHVLIIGLRALRQAQGPL